MSKSLLYAGSNTPLITVATGTVIPFNNIVRRYGCNINVSGGNAIVKGAGYYEGRVKITYTGAGAGTLNVAVYKNGTAIPYAEASATTAEAVINTLTIPFVIRDNCDCDSTITAIASGAVVTATNVSIEIEKE